MAPEGRVYWQEKMLHPAYKPPLCFVLAKVEKEGEVMYLQTSNLACMSQL